MKRVGIITFNNAYSYGAVLQAYALCKTINNIEGVKAELINYGNVGKGERFHKLAFVGIKSILYNLACNIVTIGSEDIRRCRFRRFIKNDLNLSSIRYKKNNLSTANNNYDIIIAGSDQVWNPYINQKDTAYLLEFVNENSKKVSYAASFGLEKFPPQYLEIYKKGLKKFGSLSVRESSGQTIIKELTGRDSEVVLDPTFLVNKNEWDEVASSPSKFRIKNYLLLFLLPGSIQLGTIKDYLEYFVKGTEIQIVSIGNNIDKLKSNFKIISTAGPREFLWLIKNANYIVTNSFHGTAFSIIFEKNFYTLLNNNERDSRLVEIVNKLELGDRLINPQTNKCILGLNQIDYYLVKNILDKEIDKSLVFLNSSIFKSC